MAMAVTSLTLIICTDITVKDNKWKVNNNINDQIFIFISVYEITNNFII